MRKIYVQNELEFQKAQSNWLKDINDRRAYARMWELVQLAVYNAMHKALACRLDHDTIEERSMDITVRIFRSIQKKRAKGKDWRIGRLSSYVYNACKWRFNEKWKMEDLIIYRAEIYGR